MIKINKYYKILFLMTIISFSSISFAAEVLQNISGRNENFVGRKALLVKVKNHLAKYRIVYLTGYGGIGKTQLANEYCYVNAGKYDLIWWLDLKNDLKKQYENLLIHFNNDSSFTKLLQFKAKDVPSEVIIDFTNSLLAKSNIRWLLVFDNAGNQKLNLPKPKSSQQHIIVTTREQQGLDGNNAIIVEPFDDHEAADFLFKRHPQEKTEDLTTLHKALHNYPLALAQVSEAILAHKWDINNNPTQVSSKQVGNYNEMLDFTLQKIEQEDKQAAKVLYMLSLLKVDITPKMIANLFGGDIDKALVVLNKYGVIKGFRIHDVIRDVALKRFNQKNLAYKKDIITTLSKYFKKFYFGKPFCYLGDSDMNNDLVTPLYALVETALATDLFNEEVADLAMIALRLNDTLFNRHADYQHYQKLADKIYTKDISTFSPLKQAMLISSLAYADFIFASKEALTKYEATMLQLLAQLKTDKDHEELFYIYTYFAQFYLLLGDLHDTKKYLDMTQQHLDYIGNISSLLQYWYIKVWHFYASREITEGIKALHQYEQLVQQLTDTEVDQLAIMSFRTLLEILNGQKAKAAQTIAEASTKAKVVYAAPSNITVHLEAAKTLLYFQEKKYDLALQHGLRTLMVFKQVFDDVMTSPHYVMVAMIIGEIYEHRGNYDLALAYYKKCLKYFDAYSDGERITTFEYGKLLSNLCRLYYHQGNYALSRLYFKKVIDKFDLDSTIFEQLIKELPVDYVYKINT